MSRKHHIDLTCEIDPKLESIHGEMSNRQGMTLPFWGWTEFAGVLIALAKDDSERNQSSNEEQ